MSGVVHYTPGDVPVIVTAHGIVVVGVEVTPALSARLWAELSGGRGLPAVLEAFTGEFGTSLANIPPFAVALAEGSVIRLAVRGVLSVQITALGGSQTISGEGVTTWSERIVSDVSRVEISLDTDAAVPSLPIGDGVVLAGAIEWLPAQLSSTPTVDLAPEPVVVPLSVVTPEPAPVAVPAAPVLPSVAVPSAPVLPSVAVPSAPVPPPPVPPLPPIPTLIDSTAVLSLADADTLLPPDATLAPPAEPDVIDASTTGYDHLWGATVARVVEDAAVRADDEDSESTAVESAAIVGDHDGHTLSIEEARALRSRDFPALLDSAPPPLAPPRRPAPGRIRLSTGQVLQLDRTIVIGRRPRSTRITGTDLPHLVAVESPDQDISRSHIELRVEGDSIMATDLHTTNGSTLLRAGVDPTRLHPGEPTVVVVGDVISLGDEITVHIEEVE